MFRMTQRLRRCLPVPDEPWLLVSGGFHGRGGMDKANLALAEYLADSGRTIHLVCHECDQQLAAHPMVTVHRVRRPANSYFLGSPLLDWTARRVARQLALGGFPPRCVANGGNCMLPDVNWAHFVHAAWKPSRVGGSLPVRMKRGIEHSIECRRERAAYARARIIIANSEITRQHIRKSLGEQGERADIRVIYLGSETEWGAIAPEERNAARRKLQIRADRRIALFVGGLGFDGRKGFDVLLKAWRLLCNDPTWDADLLVAGTGPARDFWRTQVAAANLSGRVRMLGFSNDVPGLLAAADLLVSTPRYEPYGLNVQEALARGLPVVCSAQAGIAERFPDSLRPLLLGNAEDETELVQCLRVWRSAPELWCDRVASFSRRLCARTWTDMAREMTESMEFLVARRSLHLVSHDR